LKSGGGVQKKKKNQRVKGPRPTKTATESMNKEIRNGANNYVDIHERGKNLSGVKPETRDLQEAERGPGQPR